MRLSLQLIFEWLTNSVPCSSLSSLRRNPAQVALTKMPRNEVKIYEETDFRSTEGHLLTSSDCFLTASSLDVVQENKYQEVLEELRNDKVEWNWTGPANKRHFEHVAMESAPSIVQQLAKLLQSQPMFKLLRTMTGLEMADVPLSDDDDDSDEDDDDGSKDINKKTDDASERGPCCHGSIRRWTHGCYTLVHDTDPEGAEFALDVLFYVGGSGWKSDYGGYTTYLTSGEDEELLTVHPQENSLALVYRDKETLRFVKHVNHSVLTDVGTVDRDNNFFDFSFVYFE